MHSYYYMTSRCYACLIYLEGSYRSFIFFFPRQPFCYDGHMLFITMETIIEFISMNTHTHTHIYMIQQARLVGVKSSLGQSAPPVFFSSQPNKFACSAGVGIQPFSCAPCISLVLSVALPRTRSVLPLLHASLTSHSLLLSPSRVCKNLFPCTPSRHLYI